ncbi:A-kinase anchor protein inhibitor 1 isoform X2 [Kogia breviceps]|uniref:A-kinase anchor protein inhibitor 1 isoform X2 n=1 Tax=Kogia breviceps TaxID=27615 RepID=UPI0034D2EA41
MWDPPRPGHKPVSPALAGGLPTTAPPGEKPGSEPEEAKLQIASKQIVQSAILRAVQQVSLESRQREARAGDTPRGSFRPGTGELTKKHEKKQHGGWGSCHTLGFQPFF